MKGKPEARLGTGPGNRAQAEDVAVQGLTFLTATPERLGRFFDISGLRPETFRSAAQFPGFFAGLLDYIVGDEELLISFAAEMGLKPEAITRARQVLSPPEPFD